MNPISSRFGYLFGGKSHFPVSISIDDAPLAFSINKHKRMIAHLNEEMFPEICENCLGTGEVILSPTVNIPCFYCNGSGRIKKCTCGSGIKIGKDELFCIMCKPQPKLVYNPIRYEFIHMNPDLSLKLDPDPEHPGPRLRLKYNSERDHYYYGN